MTHAQGITERADRAGGENVLLGSDEGIIHPTQVIRQLFGSSPTSLFFYDAQRLLDVKAVVGVLSELFNDGVQGEEFRNAVVESMRHRFFIRHAILSTPAMFRSARKVLQHVGIATSHEELGLPRNAPVAHKWTAPIEPTPTPAATGTATDQEEGREPQDIFAHSPRHLPSTGGRLPTRNRPTVASLSIGSTGTSWGQLGDTARPNESHPVERRTHDQ